MKKKLLAVILILSMLIPQAVYAATPQWYVDKKVNAEKGEELSFDDAPSVVVMKSDLFKRDFRFEVELINAQWLYEDSGEIEKGIDYVVFGDTTLIVMVDIDDFDASKRDIVIPLHCVVSDDAEVLVRSEDYNLTREGKGYFADLPYEDNTTVKYFGNGKLYGEADELGDIVIEEWKAKSLEKGGAYYLSLTNGFKFVSTGEVTVTGDFVTKNGYEYSFDDVDPERLEIKFLDAIENPKGLISITGIKVAATKDSSFRETSIVITRDYDREYEKSVDIGEYIQSVPSDAPLKVVSVKMDKEKIEIEGTGAPSKKVRVYVGGSVIGETRVDTKGEWKLEKEFTKELSEGTYLVETGYYSNSTSKFTSVVKTDVDVYKVNNENVYFTVGVDKYRIGAKEFDIDGGLYIDSNDRMMVPLRALANAIGVEDDDIKWNDTAKSIILEKDDRKIEVYIGSDKLLINGLEVKMNTEAVIKNSRTYLPLRSICEAFGRSNIVWDGTTKTVMIGK